METLPPLGAELRCIKGLHKKAETDDELYGLHVGRQMLKVRGRWRLGDGSHLED